MADISETLAPKSDQLDAVDLLGGPRIFTVDRADVRQGAEQPVTIHLVEFPRPWRPGKNMRRVLAFCWGRESSGWPGQRVELYCDTDVVFGGKKVGGTRIKRLSGISERTSVPVLITAGRSSVYEVDPLPDAAATVRPETLADLEATLVRKGIPTESWLAGANSITGGDATNLKALTEDQARQVLAALAQRPDAPTDTEGDPR